jgi:hypothetical protein
MAIRLKLHPCDSRGGLGAVDPRQRKRLRALGLWRPPPTPSSNPIRLLIQLGEKQATSVSARLHPWGKAN